MYTLGDLIAGITNFVVIYLTVFFQFVFLAIRILVMNVLGFVIMLPLVCAAIYAVYYVMIYGGELLSFVTGPLR